MPSIQSDYLHLVITRYNVGLYRPWQKSPLWKDPEEWMIHRLPIFTHYCLPSILNQTCSQFLWLVLFDQQTPSKWLRQILPLLSRPHFVPLIVDSQMSHPGMCELIRRFVPQTVRFLVTTPLDNDDFFASDFVQQVHDAMREDREVPYILDVRRIRLVKEQGMRLQDLLVGDVEQPYSADSGYATPFLTVVENKQVALTCWHAAHRQIRQILPRYIVLRDCWGGAVVHGMNLSPRERKAGMPITADIIAELVDKFRINPDRLKELSQRL